MSTACTDQYNRLFVDPGASLTLSPSEAYSRDEQLEMLRRMMVIRGFEERVAALYRDGEVPGFVHLSTGQEASAVGACWPLRDTDVLTSTHRGHGHCLAKGLAPLGMFAELMARDGGTNRGRGGSMHIADPTIGIFGANGIVGAGLPIAVGAAAAAQLRAEGNVAVAFFGDGAVAQGAFHEAVNLAAVWNLPVVFWCENNGYAEFSPAATQHAAPLEKRAAGYGVDYVSVDGNDVVAVATTMTDVLAAVRGGRPVIVEAATYRWHGHYEGDPQRYRSDDELDDWKLRDPIVVQTQRLESIGVDIEEIVGARSRRSTPRSTRRWPGPGRRRHPRSPRCTISSCASDPPIPNRNRRLPTRRSSARWMRSTTPWRSSWPTTPRCSSPGSTWPRAATSSG